MPQTPLKPSLQVPQNPSKVTKLDQHDQLKRDQALENHQCSKTPKTHKSIVDKNVQKCSMSNNKTNKQRTTANETSLIS